MKGTRFRIACALALAVSGLLSASPVWGQASPHPTTQTGGPSSLPPGDGTVRGVVVDGDAPNATGGLTVALYALQPDGTPGIGSTQTATDGSFEFREVSSDPAIVYLVGVRYALVPYGERTAFVPGQRVIDLMLPVERPTMDASGLTILETTLRIESRGSRIAVQETHKLANAGSAPVFVPGDAREGKTPPFQALLPLGAVDFQTGAFGSTGDFEQQGSEVLYWGPVYTGEQELRYSYMLPVASGASVVSLDQRFPLGTGRVRVLTPEHGPRVESADLISGEPVEVEGTRFSVQESGARGPGGGVALSVHVPETSSDASVLSLGRAELSIELDDTILEVTQSQRIEVKSGAHVAGEPGSPLLRFDLPLPAQLVGLSTGSGQLGASAVDLPTEKAIEVYGPLGPGSHDFSFRYRMPANGGAVHLDLQFPLAIPTLSIRAADTGLLIESQRLHRLRPQTMGTRTWMLREAFQVEPDEIVSVRFEALDQSGPSQLAGVFFLFVASGFVLLFVVGPLRQSRTARGVSEADRSGLAHERDLVYATIRDLEHDFETGKVSQPDYESSRAELRAQAVALMREDTQRGGAPAPGASADIAETPSKPQTLPTRRFCPACGGAVDRAWSFCSHCGGELNPAGAQEPDASGASGSEPAA